jgi:hypothetical protein
LWLKRLRAQHGADQQSVAGGPVREEPPIWTDGSFLAIGI